jgi:prepilin-type N-terminal cleavage/methylation domain-containing protein
MKTIASLSISRSRRDARRSQAFTLTEMMTASAVFSLFIGLIITSHLYGMRMYEIAKAKLGVSYEARTTLMTLLTDIRSAIDINIGTGTFSTFLEVTNGAQIGNAIRVFPTTNQAQFIQYFLDTDNSLKRFTNGMASPTVVVHAITNATPFTAEDYKGAVLQNNQNNRVIGLNMEFYQVQYPVVPIPGRLFEYYKWQTKITRRAI